MTLEVKVDLNNFPEIAKCVDEFCQRFTVETNDEMLRASMLLAAGGLHMASMGCVVAGMIGTAYLVTARKVIAESN